jgi:DNA-binding MarR family transcriptional regulator
MGSNAHDPAKTPAALLLAITPHLTRWVQTQLSGDEEHDLSLRQLTALRCIGEPSTTLGDVARHLNVTPAVVTGLIDRLERRGYVRRVGSQFDRRRVHIELTSEGEDIRDQAGASLSEELRRRIGELAPAEIDALTGGLQILGKVVDRMESDRSR